MEPPVNTTAEAVHEGPLFASELLIVGGVEVDGIMEGDMGASVGGSDMEGEGVGLGEMVGNAVPPGKHL